MADMHTMQHRAAANISHTYISAYVCVRVYVNIHKYLNAKCSLMLLNSMRKLKMKGGVANCNSRTYLQQATQIFAMRMAVKHMYVCTM